MSIRGLGTIIVCLLAAGLAAVASGRLGYVESSNGLVDNPELEGGRTELEFADINDDGAVDILSIGDHGSPYIGTQEHGIMVWFGDGRGGWSVYQNGDFGYGGIAVGDVDNDGCWDVGYGMHHDYSSTDFGDQLIEVALGDGSGRNWTPWDDSLATHGETYGMFCTDFADIDHDGRLDLVANSFGGTAGVHVYRNLGDGTWDQTFGFTGGFSRDDVVFGDIDRDGNPDIAVSQQFGTVYFGDPDGGFTGGDRNLPPPGDRGHAGVALGDVDNDGGKDLAFVKGDTVHVWKYLPAGDSWISLRRNLPLGGGYEMVQLCDMDCDGCMDLVGFGRGSGTVWLGDGGANWTQAATFTTPAPGYCQALRCGGDVDHNGFPDVALVSDEGYWPNDQNHARCFRDTSVPGNLWISPVFPRGGERFWSGSAQFIDWACAVPPGDTARVRLEFSVSGPEGPWELIADTVVNSGRTQWLPSGTSRSCYVRYIARTSQAADTAITPRAFTVDDLSALAEPRPARSRRRMVVTVSPNPVRGRASIAFELREAGRARVSMTDIAGRSERILLDAAEPAGPHRLVADFSGLPAGVYFCRVRTEGADVRAAVCVVR